MAIMNMGGALPSGLHEITLIPSPADGGTVTGGGMVSEGMTVTVAAAKNSGYLFSGWKEGQTAVSTDNQYTFTVSKTRLLTAEFLEDIAGNQWATSLLPYNERWLSAAYGNGKFVAVSGSETNSAQKAAYSPPAA